MTTHTLTIPIPKPPMSSNDQRRAHWTKVRSAKAEVEMLVKSAARAAKLPRIAKCSIRVVWHAPDARRRDGDSLGPFVKASLDALTQGWLVDDSWAYVTETTMAVCVDRARPRIEIQITEITEAA